MLTAHAMPPQDTLRVSAVELNALCRSLLVAAGCAPRHADRVADTLVWAEAVGLPEQGVWRLPHLLHKLCDGSWQPDARPTVLPLRSRLCQIDGRSAPGPSAALDAVEECCGIARNHGLGVALLRGSVDMGNPLYYAWECAERGFPTIIASWNVVQLDLDQPVVVRSACFGRPSRDGHHLLSELHTSALPLPGGAAAANAALSRRAPTGIALILDCLKHAGLERPAVQELSAIVRERGAEADSGYAMLTIDATSADIAHGFFERLARDHHRKPRDPESGTPSLALRDETMHSGIPIDAAVYGELRWLGSQLSGFDHTPNARIAVPPATLRLH